MRSQMENYSYGSYPESGDSSPRSREMEFENPPPWEEQNQNQNQKVKFMCSYGGKIHPRPHDNQLSYVGGHTKILAVDRSVNYSSLLSKLSSLSSHPDVSFKYQLPGEDLDALISVTNDDDLDHLMHEYDRLFRATAKHARMRLFLFSDQADSSSPDPKSNVDFLFGHDVKGMAPPSPVKMQEIAQQEAVMAPLPGFPQDDPFIRSDDQMQRQLQRMQIGRKSNDNFVPPPDYYVPNKMPEKIQPPSPVHMAPTAPPPGFWAEKQLDQQQAMYMVQTHQGGVYHAPVMDQAAGYYVQRMGHDHVYREQPQVYSMPQPQMTAPPPKVTAYSEAPRPGAGGGAYTTHPQVAAYENGMGRQVYYNALQPQQQYHQGGDTRTGAAAKMVTKPM